MFPADLTLTQFRIIDHAPAADCSLRLSASALQLGIALHGNLAAARQLNWHMIYHMLWLLHTDS